jgi:hypothetical protein
VSVFIDKYLPADVEVFLERHPNFTGDNEYNGAVRFLAYPSFLSTWSHDTAISTIRDAMKAREESESKW